MEQKTMGSFLAALRKANGLTQKELAEKLNVSDKSVSRWERDEGTPDLSLVPVIAEIFGVTCDELLRGQRLTRDAPPDRPRTEKQRARIVAASLSGFRTKSCIAIGLALCGFLAAMIGNFAFLRAYLGFFAGAVFFLAAVIVQVVCVNSTLLSVSGEDVPPAAAGAFRRSVALLAEKSVGLALSLLAATLPLVLFISDAHCGLDAGPFFRSGLLFGGIAAAILAAAAHFLNQSLHKRGFFHLDEAAAAAYRHNSRLKERCAAALVALLLATAFFSSAATGFGDTGRLAKGTVFEDYGSFREFMEQDIPAADEGAAKETALPQYYDEAGNPISEEEALTRTIEADDGTVLCSFVHRNKSVVSWRYGGDGLPITVFTQSQFAQARQTARLIQTAFAFACLPEAAVVVLVYFRRRVR